MFSFLRDVPSDTQVSSSSRPQLVKVIVFSTSPRIPQSKTLSKSVSFSVHVASNFAALLDVLSVVNFSCFPQLLLNSSHDDMFSHAPDCDTST